MRERLRAVLTALLATFFLLALAHEAFADSPPSILSDPYASTVCAGATTTFTVTASDATSYQWQVDTGGSTFYDISNNAPYSGATTPTLTIAVATAGLSGYRYRAIVSGAVGPVATSNNAALIVNTAPQFTSQPSSSSILAGGTTVFTTTTSNATSYQWQVDQGAGFNSISNNSVYSGATTRTLTITGASASMSGYLYRAVASGNCTPTARSNNATLTVVSPPIANAVSATVDANTAGNTITLNITGGTASTVAIETDPSHGSVNVSGTTITYTPVAGYSGTDSFTYTASNDAGTSSAATASITVTPPVLAMTPSGGALTGGQAGLAYSTTLSASLGTAPYTFQIIGGALPPGLTLSNANKTISGTPSATGTFNYSIRVTDAYGATGTAAYSLTVVCMTPDFTPAKGTPLYGTTGVPFSQTFSASMGMPGFFSGSGTEIRGLSFDSNTRTYSGIPTQPDAQNFTVDFTDIYGCPDSGTYLVTISYPTITMAPAAGAVTDAVTGVAYSETISASGGSEPYSFTLASGSLPAGMTLDATTGKITGTATSTGTANFRIKATDAYGAAAEEGYTITVNHPTISMTPVAGAMPGGIAGVAYNQTVAASGGTEPYTYDVPAGALPPGMTLNTITGDITGAPTATGTFNTTITATDAYGAVGSRNYSYTIDLPTVSFTPADNTTLTTGTTGTAYSQTFTTTGTTASNLNLSNGSLPTGLTFDSGSNTLSGTPSETGNFSFKLAFTDAYGGYYEANYAMAVTYPTITVTPATGALPGAFTGVSYSQTVAASGGSTPYTYAVTAGALPAGMTLDSATGIIRGTSTTTTNARFTIKATDVYGASTATAYTLTVAYPALTLTPIAGALPGGKTGVAYSQTVSASGGTAPYSFAVSAGTLPVGLTLNGTTGKISGTPTTAGNTSFTIRATDAHGAIKTAAYTVAVTLPTLSLTPVAGALPGGKTGIAYSQTVSASGGTVPYTFAVSAGTLPVGLTLNGTTGKISGTPTTTGTASVTIKATDAHGATVTAGYTIAITSPTIVMTPATGALPGGTTGIAYSQTVSASGGTSPYTYAVSSGALPVGVTLNATTGKLGGKPTAAGKATFKIKATDAHGAAVTMAYTITVSSPRIVLTPAAGALPGGIMGLAYNQTVAASGGTSPYSYAVASGALPAGVTLNRTTGKLGGKPPAAGKATFTIKATDANGATGTAAYTVAIAAPRIVLTPVTGALPGGTIGFAYKQTVSASGGTTPYAYTVSSGTLPAGLTLNATSGRLGGKPTASAKASFTIKATDANGASASVRYTLAVIAPTIAVLPAAGALPEGKTGKSYNLTLAASGGTAPYKYTVTKGALPAGLKLGSTTGVINGKPTAAGKASFTVRATDAYGVTRSVAYTMTVIQSLKRPVANAVSAKVAANASATAIALKITGDAAESIAIATKPSNGTVTITGLKLTYKPKAGYSGPDSFTYTARNAAGTSAAASVTITVTAPTFAFTPAAGNLGKTMAGEAYRQKIAAKGGQAPMLYSLASGTLPKGMILNVSTGELTGPLDAKSKGDYSFAIRAKDNNGVTGTAAYTLKVTPRQTTVKNIVVEVAAGAAPTDVYLNSTATGGPFTDAKFTFVEPSNAGTAKIIRGQLAQAGAAEAPAGWYLQFTPNPAFSGKAQVGFQLTSALGVSNTGTITYNVSFNAGEVADDIDTLVQGFVSTRQGLIASEIYIPGLLERRQMETAADPVIARMTPSEDGMTASLTTSFAQLDAARDRADGVTGAPPRAFNAWIDLAFLAHNRDENGSKWGSFAMLNLGADYMVTEKALVGLSFHFDHMTDPTDADAELTGNGWLVGPNASLELGRGVFWDTSLLYGGSANDIDTTLWDGSFDTTRWMLDTAITGQWNLDEATVLTPKLRALYFSETVDDYTVRNSAGDTVTVEGFDEEQFRVSLGAEIERSFTLDNGSKLKPKLGATAGYSGLDGSGAFGSLMAGVSLETTDLWMFDLGFLFNLAEDGEKSIGGRAKASRQF